MGVVGPIASYVLTAWRISSLWVYSGYVMLKLCEGYFWRWEERLPLQFYSSCGYIAEWNWIDLWGVEYFTYTPERIIRKWIFHLGHCFNFWKSSYPWFSLFLYTVGDAFELYLSVAPRSLALDWAVIHFQRLIHPHQCSSPYPTFLNVKDYWNLLQKSLLASTALVILLGQSRLFPIINIDQRIYTLCVGVWLHIPYPGESKEDRC